MRILTIIFILLFPSLLLGFGKADYVKIDLEKNEPAFAGGSTRVKIGSSFCERSKIKIEFYNTNKSNVKKVVVACEPYTSALVIYFMSNKQADEFFVGVKGKYDCMNEDGIDNCKKPE